MFWERFKNKYMYMCVELVGFFILRSKWLKHCFLQKIHKDFEIPSTIIHLHYQQFQQPISDK